MNHVLSQINTSVRLLQLGAAGAGSQWLTDKTYSVAKFCENRNHAEHELIFFELYQDKVDTVLKNYLSRHYHFPLSYWTLAYLRSNGYGFCEKTVNDDGMDTGFSTYFRFLVKHVKPIAGIQKYSWDEMTFLFHLSTTGQLTLIFIGCPPSLQQFIISEYPSKLGAKSFSTMITFLQSLISEIVAMYDDAVWDMRDVIRSIEKERTKKPRFAEVHDQARHAIHITEVLQVAVTTVESLKGCYETTSIPTPLADDVTKALKDTTFQSHMQISMQMLKNINLRSCAIEKRFLNEINLAFNLVSQKDSIVMKSLAMFTLFFLPATFVSTIFGMGFFDTYDDAAGQSHLVIASPFWVYWAIAVPLTGFTVFGWLHWTSKSLNDARSSDKSKHRLRFPKFTSV